MNLDELKALSQATLAGIRGGDTNAGTADAAVNDFARSSFTDALTNSFNVGGAAQAAAAAEKEREEQARRAEMQKIQDKLDPSKYTMRRKEDGGFDFIDPDGNLIDINRYSQVTGQRPADILKYSDNPFDQQFVNDYNNTKGVIDAIQQGDTDTLQAYLKDNANIDPNMKPEDLMKELIRRYPHIYGAGQYADSIKNNGNSIFRYNLGLGAGTGSAQGGISTSDYGY